MYFRLYRAYVLNDIDAKSSSTGNGVQPIKRLFDASAYTACVFNVVYLDIYSVFMPRIEWDTCVCVFVCRDFTRLSTRIPTRKAKWAGRRPNPSSAKFKASYSICRPLILQPTIKHFLRRLAMMSLSPPKHLRSQALLTLSRKLTHIHTHAITPHIYRYRNRKQ